MTSTRNALLPVLALVFAACGPGPAPGDGGTTTTTGESGSTDESTSSVPPNPSTDDGLETESEGEDDGPIPDIDLPEDTSCDPWAQDCDEGQKCVPYASNGSSWDAFKCVPVGGEQGPGDPCVSEGVEAGTDDCDAGSYCFYLEEVEGQLEGICLSMCTGSPSEPECPAMSACSISGDGSLLVCLPTCDPLTQEGCPEDLACHWTNSVFSCTPQGDDIPPGGSCGFVNVCTPGTICLDASVVPTCAGDDVGCCSPYCDVDDPGDTCDAVPGTTCVSFWDEGQALEGYESLGVCVAP